MCNFIYLGGRGYGGGRFNRDSGDRNEDENGESNGK